MIKEKNERWVWILSFLVIAISLAAYLGVVVPRLPRSGRVGISIEILVVSGITLLVICVGTKTRLVYSPVYRFVAVWGVSLPLVVTFLSSIGERDGFALFVNILLVVLVLVWANWMLAVLGRRRTFIALFGLVLMAVGVLVLVGSWGSLTLGDWPMTPYLSYLLDQSIIYFGLLLFAVGLVLWVCGTEQPAVRRVAGRLAWGLLSHLKEVAVLALVIGLVVGVLVVYILVRVPFPKDVSRVDATGLGVLHLIKEVEELDIGLMVGRTLDDGRFPPWFVDGDVLDYFLERSWRFKIHAPDHPGFRENGWLKYKARVERFDGWVERKGINVTARTSDGGFSVSRAPMTYWYAGGESTRIAGGFVVIMELSYMEIYGNIGAKGFSVGPQYAFFDREERLVAILTPEKVGMRMA